MAIVRVALPIPVPQVFDYVAADATEADVGRCVKVPFGRGDRNGLIVALGEEGEVGAVLRCCRPESSGSRRRRRGHIISTGLSRSESLKSMVAT